MATTWEGHTLVVLLTCVNCIHGRGDKYSEDYGEYTEDDGEYSSGASMLVWAILGSVVGVGAFFCAIFCCFSVIRAFCESQCPCFVAWFTSDFAEDTGEIEEGKVWCILCCCMVPQEEWSWEGHRKECASSNYRKINRLTPCNFDKCPVCEEGMKYCEVDGKWFDCAKNRSCQNGQKVKNDSIFTRAICFKCDVNYCIRCTDNITAQAGDEIQEGYVSCHLCFRMLPQEDWSREGHREECASIYSPTLNRLAPCDQEKCPVCQEGMKYCEVDGKWFHCDKNRLCQNGELVRNDRIRQRVNCFICDVSYCGRCVNGEEAEDESDNNDTAPSAPEIGAVDEQENPHEWLLPPPNTGNPPCYDDAVTA